MKIESYFKVRLLRREKVDIDEIKGSSELAERLLERRKEI